MTLCSDLPEDGGGAWPSEMLVSYYISTQCHNPEDHNSNFHHHENLKFHIFTGQTLCITLILVTERIHCVHI
jgi:hypothetical protein